MKKYYISYFLVFLCWICIAYPAYGKEQNKKFREKFQYVEVFGIREGIRITKYIGEDKKVFIPNKINGKPVTEIGDFAFADQEILESVVTPTGSFLKKIGKNAFSNCSSLQQIDLTSSQLEIIEDKAFFECYMLKKAQFPSSLKFLGEKAFYNNTVLENVELGESLEQIGSKAFYRCIRLQSIQLPRGLKRLTSEDSSKEQGAVFYECTSLKSVQIGDGITKLPEKTFYGCSELEKISLPDTMIEIGEKAFSYCSSLRTVQFPKYLKVIEYGAFYQCIQLKQLLFPESLQNIESAEYDGNATFGKCIALTDVIFGEKIQTIGNSAFEGCKSLSTVIFPASIDKVYDNAFKNCSELKSIYCLGELPMVFPESFSSVNQAFSFYILPSVWKREIEYPVKEYQLYDVMTTINLFDKQGGSLTRSFYVKKKGYSFYPEEPKKKGYTFLYWNNSFTDEKWNWTSSIAGTTVLYPVWKANTYLVTFQTMGGNKIKAKKVDYKSPIGVLQVPVKTDYEFQGWYTKEDGKGTNITEKTKMPAKNITLYAKWKVSPRKPLAVSIQGDLIAKNQVRLLWERTELSDGYEIYRSLSKKGKYVKIATTSKRAKGYVNLGLSIGNTYYYKVRPYRLYQEKKVYGQFSNIEKLVVNGQPPQCTITGKKINKDSVELSWDKVKDADGYVVFYKSGKYSKIQQLASFLDNTTGCYHKNLIKGRTYWYGVRAYSIVKGKKIYGKMSSLIEININ